MIFLDGSCCYLKSYLYFAHHLGGGQATYVVPKIPCLSGNWKQCPIIISVVFMKYKL